MAAGGSKGTSANGRGGSSSSSSSGSKGASSSSPAGGASAASGGGSQSSSKGSTSSGASKGASSSSPAGGASAASGGGSQSKGSSSSGMGSGNGGKSSGASSSSPAGGSRAASGGGSTSSSSSAGKSGNAGGASKGASSSSPAGGSRAASGGGSMSSGVSAGRSTTGNSGSKSSGIGVSGSASSSLGAASRGATSLGSTTTAAGKTGRVGGTGLGAGFDSGRFGDAAPAASAAPARAMGAVSTRTGLAAGMTARSAQESSMGALAANKAADAGRFGSKATARAAEDSSMSTLAAQRSIGAVARAAPDTARFGAKPTARAAEDGSMTMLGAQRAIGAVPNAAPVAGPKFAEKSPRVSTAVTERMLGVNSDAVADMLAGRESAPALSKPTARMAQDSSMTALGAAQAAGTVPGKTGRIGKGLAVAADIDPARFGPNTPTPMASTLRTSPNYGVGYAQQARAAEDMSVARQDAWDKTLGTIQAAEAQQAPNPKTGVADPYNGLVGSRKGKKAPTHADLADMTISQVQNYQKGMKKAGHLSTAVGAYQMMAGTLAEAVEMAGYDPTTTKFTKAVQDQLARTLVDDKRVGPLASSRKGVTPASVAQGLAKEWAGLETKTGKGYYDKDGINHASASYGDVLGAATDLVNSGAVGPDRLNGTSPVAGPIRSAAAVGGKKPASQTPTRTAAAAAAAERFSSTYLGKPAAAAAATTAKGKKERSLGEKVLAGAIDVGVGMIPGVGLAAGVYGLAAPMLGLPTVGEMALNLRDTNQYSVTEAANKKAGVGAGSTARPAATTKSVAAAPAAAVAAPAASVSSFSEKYLGFSDPTPRQTPGQKWGGIGAPTPGYAL